MATKTTKQQPLDGLTITSATLGNPRLHLQVHATIAGQKYEFVRLRPGAQLEVYDHPRSYRGLPRFCGYADSLAVADHLEELARRWLDRRGALRGTAPHWWGGAW